MGAVTPYWVAGKPATSDQVVEVTHPYDGHVVAVGVPLVAVALLRVERSEIP